MLQMQAQQAPAKQGTPMFSPGAPLTPAQGLVNPQGPRQWQFPVGYNISVQPRSTEPTSFDTLRNLATLYDGVQLCEQVWLDTVAKLTLNIKPRPEIVAEQGQAIMARYAKKIRQYSDFFNYPDRGNGKDLKTWLRAAVRDQLQIDAVAIYVRRNRAGGVFSLELVDGTTIKPLLDPRGRRPQPPYPAYQQFIYGVPAGLYTSNEMLYQVETARTESVYGLSRVERIILRVNQALRKENKDLARFTDGNVPPAILEPPGDTEWTPEQLLAYQTMWDALLAGNDQARSRIKVVEPGAKVTTIDEDDIFIDFDRFLLNVTASCYSMTMADLGFTENVNKSSGESQENVFYRRACQPLMDRYAVLFTQILRDYFDEQDLIVAWSGFEESEDFNAMATSYAALTNAGIVSPTVAAHQMNLPWSGPDIPNYIIVPGQGVVFLEDVADPALRKAANDAKLAGLALAQNPPTAPSDDETATKSGKEQQETEKPPTPVGTDKRDAQADEDQARILRAAGSSSAQSDTGMMVAFMLKPEIAEQLALQDGEPATNLHVTLVYLGDMRETSLDRAHLSDILTSFARSVKPLEGVTGGVGRFINPGEDAHPLIALVNVPGIQELRRMLAGIVSTAGYNVANDFDYTPHITLAYIPKDSPMPINSVPSVQLTFDKLCLAIGNERFYFPLGPDQSEREGQPDFFALAADSGGHPVTRNFPWRKS